MADETAGHRARDRILTVGVALAASAATTLALARFGDAARGPFEDLETLASTFLQRQAWRFQDSSALDERSGALQGSAFARDLESLRRGKPLLTGIWDPRIETSFPAWQQLEQSFSWRFHLVGLYVGWTQRSSGSFPADSAEMIWEAGSVPLVTWEPWVRALDEEAPEDGRDCLKDIAAGRYDGYVDAFAAGAARFARPIFLRFAHEMNDPYRYPWGPAAGNDPDHFVAAFRHVRQRFALAGANQVLWIFAPSIAYRGFERYYPGADAVDWSATAVLNYGTTARWSRWWSFEELLSPGYAELARFGHPLMIAEMSSTRQGGLPSTWYDQARGSLAAGKFPAVRALVLFHDANDMTLGTHRVDFSADDEGTRRAVAALLSGFQSQRQ